MRQFETIYSYVYICVFFNSFLLQITIVRPWRSYKKDSVAPPSTIKLLMPSLTTPTGIFLNNRNILFTYFLLSKSVISQTTFICPFTTKSIVGNAITGRCVGNPIAVGTVDALLQVNPFDVIHPMRTVRRPTP